MRRWLTVGVRRYSMQPSLVIVEGNISAGKSTLTHTLAAKLGYRVFLEPTSTNPYLADFYKDPKAYALRMQVYLLRRRFQTYAAAVKHILETGEGAVLDRSVFSDWVFAEKNRQDGNIDTEGFYYYTQLRERMLDGLPFPHITVYLDVPPEECHARIHGVRKRAAEVDSGIPLAYLQGLDNCYKQFLREMRERGSEVLSFDWKDFGSVDSIRHGVHNARPSLLGWNESFLRDVVASEHQLKARMRVRRPYAVVDDSDDDDILKMDLDKSNNEEIRALTAPSSPSEDSAN